MKITYRWLQEHVDVPWDWHELVERLTMAGLALEGAEDLGGALQGVVVGRVLERQPHPHADRLSVCRVDVGSEEITVVCGAPNVAAGQKVAVALPDALLPGPLTLQRATIRGVASAGMICAEDELGIGRDHSGILVLDAAAPVGQPLATQLGLDDVVLDFEVTPNRPDCLSVRGIAREVRALTGAELRMPPCDLPAAGADTAHSVTISIEDPVGCPRYLGRAVRGVRVGPSPAWLQRRLQAVGQRPINNVVDVTNCVLLELGQPLHAFDLASLTGGRIVVRRARSGEVLETLDGVRRPLDEEVLVIADAEHPVALAGIMGGANTQVAEDTVDILLESAYFAPARVRRGRSQLGLQTEAAMRFERGADWAMVPLALDRAARLIAELAGGEVACCAVDVFPNPPQPARITARAARINALLATDLEAAQMGRILTLLGCQVEVHGEVLAVTAPSFRPDLRREVDLAEEVARIHGFEDVAPRQPARAPWLAPLAGEAALQRDLRHRLTSLGFDEVRTNTIVERHWLTQVAQANGAELANPPTETQSVLRTTLVPSLLDTARRNRHQRAESVAIFELGKCFVPELDSTWPREEWRLAGLWTGTVSASPWKADRRQVDFLDLKGAVEALLAGLDPRFAAAEHPALRSGCAAQVCLGASVCGWLGEVRPALAAGFDIERTVYIFELDCGAVLAARALSVPTYVPLPKFPPIERDLAVVLPEEVDSAAVAEEIGAAASHLIESVTLFDLYRGDQVPSGHKSLAYSIRLRSPVRTLEDREADEVISGILQRLDRAFGARLR
ncbi:MAG: phenylalanine--tRNA ligase subunit beta [Candidatus Latescibacterota bacterium]